jgi:hypothetical protein
VNGNKGETLNRGPSDVVPEPRIISDGPAEPQPPPDRPVSIALREALEKLLDLKRRLANVELELNKQENLIKEIKRQVEGL